MLRLDITPGLAPGANFLWRARAPARAQARLWGIFLEVANNSAIDITPYLDVRMYGNRVLQWTLEDVLAGSSATYHVSLSGQGQRRVMSLGTDRIVVEVLPRLPWIPPDAPCEIEVSPNHANAQVTAARVLWEDLPWPGGEPRRLKRVSPEMGT